MMSVELVGEPNVFSYRRIWSRGYYIGKVTYQNGFICAILCGMRRWKSGFSTTAEAIWWLERVYWET